MASTYTIVLNLEKPATGDQVDLWGEDVINPNMDLLDALFVKPASTIYPAGFAPSDTPAFTAVDTSYVRKIAVDGPTSHAVGLSFTPSATPASRSSFLGYSDGVSTVQPILAAYGTSTGGWNIEIGGTASSFQSGDGVVYIPNGAAVPSGNPAFGVFLYVENGALKCRGSSGTVTTLAPA